MRGSGGARLAVMAEPVPRSAHLVATGAQLGGSLVARSSSPLEGGGELAGAFATYIDITPEELPKAVVGCWASAFSVDALGRQRVAGVEPGSMAMAVLVQPAIAPTRGGVAELDHEGGLVVHAVAGSPGPLLQGWEKGVVARRRAGEGWVSEQASHLIGAEVLDELGSALELAAKRIGVNRCEWGFADRLWLLQLSTVSRPAPTATRTRRPVPGELIPMVRALLAAPGVLGAETMGLSRRLGVRSWEPWIAAVAFDHGTVSHGTPAAAGVGAGVRHHADPATGATPPRRAVITADLPLSQLSQHIWDAAGLVTATGSPAAHVFEAARSLRLPAVCGVQIPRDGDLIIAVDGYSGTVATLPLESQSSP